MPVIELSLNNFTRTSSGSGTFFTETEPSVYIVDSVFPGSTSGIGSLKVFWNGQVNITWAVGNPPMNFGTNIRMGIAIRFLSLSFSSGVIETGLFIGSLKGKMVVSRVGTDYIYAVGFGSPYTIITPNYFEQLILRQESIISLSHYSFSNQNNKSLANYISFLPASLYTGQAGFYLQTSSSTNGVVLFDYFFIEEYTD
jgi:hypothetical protein